VNLHKLWPLWNIYHKTNNHSQSDLSVLEWNSDKDQTYASFRLHFSLSLLSSPCLSNQFLPQPFHSEALSRSFLKLLNCLCSSRWQIVSHNLGILCKSLLWVLKHHFWIQIFELLLLTNQLDLQSRNRAFLKKAFYPIYEECWLQEHARPLWWILRLKFSWERLWILISGILCKLKF